MATQLRLKEIQPIQQRASQYVINSVTAVKLNQQAEKKWTYLLSDSLRFSQKHPYAIKLNKPEHEKLYAWLVKIISAGECKNLFVEQLCLSEQQQANLTELAKLYAVNLISLKLTPANSNLIQGPWLK